MWPAGPEAPKDPPHARSPNRRHGPAVALADRVPPDCASEPRQSAVNAPPASTRRVDARLGPVRPASARRSASEPPSTQPHTPNRRLSVLLWPAQSGSDLFRRRSAPCRPPISARSVRFGPQPSLGRSMSPPLRRQPLKLPGSRLRRHSQGPPAPPPRPPAQFPAPPARGGTHRYSRPCTRTTGNERGMGNPAEAEISEEIDTPRDPRQEGYSIQM